LANLSEPEKVLLFSELSIMALTVEQKAQIVKDFQRKEGDTGSSEVQVALLTFRINDLTPHFSIEPVSKGNVFHRTFYGYIALIMCKLKIHLRY